MQVSWESFLHSVQSMGSNENIPDILTEEGSSEISLEQEKLSDFIKLLKSLSCSIKYQLYQKHI